MSPSCFIAPFVVKIFLQPLRDAFSLPLTPLTLCRQRFRQSSRQRAFRRSDPPVYRSIQHRIAGRGRGVIGCMFERVLMDRVIIFTNWRMAFAQDLTAEALSVLAREPDMTAVAVCDTGASSAARNIMLSLRRQTAWASTRVFNPQLDAARPRMRGPFRHMCRDHRVPLLLAPGDDINQPAFLDRIGNDLGANVALSLGCLRKFGPALLAVFDVVVNYHNGVLPQYRGLRVTDWALYHGEPRIGFTYHHMTEEFDEGPILLSDAVPVTGEERPWRIEARKTRRAAECLPLLMERIRSRDPGQPQPDGGQYFSRKAFKRIQEIGDPGGITWEELQRRLRCFGLVRLDLDGGRHPVTRVAQADGDSPFHFTTSDGVRARADRFMHLPRIGYAAARMAGMVE